MPIPESQLVTWSHQGSVTQSKDTYSTIKRALENANAYYTSRNFEVFLQGSYGNDTNIIGESDVDVVIRFDGAFYHDLSELPTEQQNAFKAYFSDGTYPYSTFKDHVQKALEAAFGSSVKPARKAIKIEANGSRRNADAVVAFEYRRYYKFNAEPDQRFDIGIALLTSDNTRIANYPKQHSENCTTKHQATGSNFKPLVRIFKNMRVKLVADGLIGKGVAPSYFIEGLLYNVPDNNFLGSYGNMVFNILTWLRATTDRTKFVCANKQYYLLRSNDPVCWPIANGEQFINAVIRLWNNWS
jgi:Nucleotidyltransferase domain